MCGIAGIAWNDPNRPVEPGLIQAMTRRLIHRGPDGEGFYSKPGVALGHRRLSIIDLAGGAQPLANEDETVWVTFNGEIYNFQDLRRQLESAGHHFRTASDTEVLVHLWEEHETDMVRHLRGMFAFAIWDERTRRLFLARDRMGQKPLVYMHDDEGLRVASELKSLVAIPGFDRSIEPAALDEYLTYQYVPHPRTIFRSARKLPPAHWALWQDGKFTIQRYWKPAPEHAAGRSWNEDVGRVRETLSEATRLRLISDVPIGAFLSGGIDSTIVAGLMQKHSRRPVQTFSIGFGIPEFDESGYARMAAEHLGTEHHELRVEASALDVVDQMAEQFDEPFGDSSAIPTSILSRLTRSAVTVALTGDGGDELFLGYDRYEAVRLAGYFDRLPAPLRHLIAARLWQRLPAPARQKSRLRQLKRFLAVLGQSPAERYPEIISIFGRGRRPGLYHRDFARTLAGHRAEAWIESLFSGLPTEDTLSQVSQVDLESYLPLDILHKVDSASMMHSLECRSPMMDHHFVELVAGLPVDRKMKGRSRKVLLKEAFSELLPAPIRSRGKMGFAIPLDHWFRGALKNRLADVLGSASFRSRGWFEMSAVEELMAEHWEHRWDHSSRLWALLALEEWARKYLDRP